MSINNKYIDLLIQKQDEATLKIPRQILPAIIKDRENYRSIEVYLMLKPIFYDGRFKRAKFRSKEIAHSIGISRSKFYRSIKRLRDLDLVQYDNKGDLLLCSWEKLFSFYGFEREDKRKFRFYRLQNTVHIRLVLKQLLIEENFKSQEKQIFIKLYKEEVLYQREKPILEKISRVSQDNSISTEDKKRTIKKLTQEIRSIKIKKRDVTRDPDFKRMKRNGVLERLYLERLVQFHKLQKEFNYLTPVNFDISISCKRMAEIFGLTSPGSGYYWQQILKINGRLEIVNRSIFIPDNKIGSGLRYFDKDELNFHYFRGKARGYFRRLNNAFKFDPLVRA